MKNNVKFRVNIQSCSDVITNSSSELFTIIGDGNIDDSYLEALKKELVEYSIIHDNERGGGYREISVYKDTTQKQYDNVFCIEIDRELDETIEYIAKTIEIDIELDETIEYIAKTFDTVSISY